MSNFGYDKKFVKPGDQISAEQENITTRFIRRSWRGPGVYDGGQGRVVRQPMPWTIHSAYFRPDSGVLANVGDVLEAYEVSSTNYAGTIYKARVCDFSDMRPDKLLVVVTQGASGLNELGTCVTGGVSMARLAPSSFTPGRAIGPSHDVKTLQNGRPGFVYLSKAQWGEDLHWVERVFENTTGQGTVQNVVEEPVGGRAVPTEIDLYQLTFDAGLYAWDDTSTFLVQNVFDDEVVDGLHCQFKWDGTQWVVTDIACPPDTP